MRRTSILRCAAGIAAAALTGCNWLDASDAVHNPNQPTSATTDQLMVSTQTALTMNYTSDLARTACVWMQQCAGTERQYLQLGVYDYGEDSFDIPFSIVYTGGGLIDLRRMEDNAGDSLKTVGGI